LAEEERALASDPADAASSILGSVMRGRRDKPQSSISNRHVASAQERGVLLPLDKANRPSRLLPL
jgi:hypothetical protein